MENLLDFAAGFCRSILLNEARSAPAYNLLLVSDAFQRGGKFLKLHEAIGYWVFD
jgi:hypothetical protein